MKSSIRAQSSIALLVATMSLASCGGGSSDSVQAPGVATPSTTGSAVERVSSNRDHDLLLSKPQLVSQADVICRRLNTKLAAAKPSGETAMGITKSVHRNLGLESQTQAKLGHLNAVDRSLARDWQQVLDDRELLVDELAVLLKAARRGDSAAIARLTASKKRSHATLRKFAKRVGFKDCAEVG